MIKPKYSTFQKKLIRIAIQEVKKCNSRNKSLHVSFLCKKRRIISVGHNKEDQTHTLAKEYIDHKVHSECHVVFRIRWFDINYSKCHVINIRLDRENVIKMSKPCPKCAAFLDLLGIKTVIFTNADGIFEKMA